MAEADTKGDSTIMRGLTLVKDPETTMWRVVLRNRHNIDPDTKTTTTGNISSSSSTSRETIRAMAGITRVAAEAAIDSSNSSIPRSITNSSRLIKATDMVLVNSKITTISSNNSSSITLLNQTIISVNMLKEARTTQLSSNRCRLKTSRVRRAPIRQRC